MTDAAYRLLLFITVVLVAAGSIVFVLLAEVQEANDLPTWSLGLIAGTFFLGALIGQFGLARFADRGWARTMLVGGALLAGIGLFWFGVATALWQLVGARLLTGLAYGVWEPSARAAVVVDRPADAGERLGKLSSATLVGIVVGPVVGAALAEVVTTTQLFVIFALVVVAITPVVARVGLPDLTADVDVVGASPVRLLRRREVVISVLVSIALVFPDGTFDALWARYLEDRGSSTLFIGFSLAVYGVPFAVLAPVGGRLADRRDPMRIALVSLAALVPIVLLYGHAAEPWAILVMAVLEAAATAIGYPAVQAAMARACAKGELATGQGLASGAGLAGAGLGSLVAAPLYGAHGPGWTFGFAALVVAVIAALAAVGDRSAEVFVEEGRLQT